MDRPMGPATRYTPWCNTRYFDFFKITYEIRILCYFRAEYGGKWKALHYFATKFFAPVSLIVFEDDTILKVYAASDLLTPMYGTLQVLIHTWDSFTPTGQYTAPYTILPNQSGEMYSESIGSLLHYGGCPYKVILLRALLQNVSMLETSC